MSTNQANPQRLTKSICVIAFAAVVVGGLKVAAQSFESRELYRQLEASYQNQVELEALHGQLQIELGSRTSPAYIEEQARDGLVMDAPKHRVVANTLVLQALTLQAGAHSSNEAFEAGR